VIAAITRVVTSCDSVAGVESTFSVKAKPKIDSRSSFRSQKGTIMMRLLTALVLGFCLAACSSSSTAPSPPSPPPASSATVTFVPGQSFSLNPTSAVFGNQMVNTTSASRAATVTNTGSTPQPVRGRMNGTPGQWQDFAFTNDCPTMLAVGASCTFNITFTPSATGGRGAVLVVDGTNDEEGFVNVGGTGTN
jgi:hypothetical protein